jgi:hypothetical protein
VFAPPRKYLTEAARLPNELGLHAAEVDREEDIHSARERLAKLIVGRRCQGCDSDSIDKDLGVQKMGSFWRHCATKRDSPQYRTFFFC